MKKINYIKGLDWVWLFWGLAITVVYIVFADPLYEAMYLGSDDFADAMYENNQYFVIALISCLCSWCIAIIYYLLVDSSRLNSFIWWLCGLVITWGLSLWLTVYIPDQTFINMGEYEYAPFLWNLGWINVAVCVVVYFIASLSLKNMSVNVSTRPF